MEIKFKLIKTWQNPDSNSLSVAADYQLYLNEIAILEFRVYGPEEYLDKLAENHLICTIQNLYNITSKLEIKK